MDWDAFIRPEVAPMVPYSPGLRASEVRERSGRADVCKLSSNENPYGPVPAAIAAMRAVLPRLNRYPDGSARALRGRLAEHLGVDPAHLVIGNGSNELIDDLGYAFLRPGDEVVFAWPSFVVYPMVTQVMGATAVKVPLDEQHAHDLDAMLSAITDKTRLVFLCNPNNPTGTIYDVAAFERFLDRVPEHVLVVVDEAYFEYVRDASYPDGVRYFDGVRPLVVLRTFSKIYSLAGLRVGYAIAPEAVVSALNRVREPFNVNTVAQVAAYHSLSDQAEIARRAEENAEQKDVLYACFERLGIEYVRSHTNFVYIHTDRPADLFEALLGQGVIVRDFGTAPALRVSVGTPEDTRRTCEAFELAMARLGEV